MFAKSGAVIIAAIVIIVVVVVILMIVTITGDARTGRTGRTVDCEHMLVQDLPLVQHGVPVAVLALDSLAANALLMKSDVPPNCFVEVHDDRRLMMDQQEIGHHQVSSRLRLVDAYNAMWEASDAAHNELWETQVVAVAPKQTSGERHLCFVVQADHREFRYIDELAARDWKEEIVVGVLDMERDPQLVREVVRMCGINPVPPLVFRPIQLPLTTQNMPSFTFAALYMNLAQILHRDPSSSSGNGRRQQQLVVVEESLRINFLQIDRSLSMPQLTSRFPTAVPSSYDMRSFFPPQNVTSSFPITMCIAFEYVLVLDKPRRSPRQASHPLLLFDSAEQEHQYISLLARKCGDVARLARLEFLQSTSAFGAFGLHAAAVELLKEFDAITEQTLSSNNPPHYY